MKAPRREDKSQQYKEKMKNGDYGLETMLLASRPWGPSQARRAQTWEQGEVTVHMAQIHSGWVSQPILK